MLPQSGRFIRGEDAKYAMPSSRNVADGILRRGEYVVLEERRPGAAGGRGQLADAQYPLQQCIKSRIRTGPLAGEVVPPIVHEYVERLEGFNVVPPERRDVDCIPRTQVSHLSRGERLTKFRVAFEVRFSKRHQAHGRAGRREVERTDVKVRDLVRRKQSESSAPGDHAPDVVSLIDVGGLVMRLPSHIRGATSWGRMSKWL